MANSAVSPIEREARKKLTPEQKARGEYATEWMAEPDAHGSTEQALDVAVMRKMVPVPGLRSICKHPDFGPAELKACRMFHADVLAAKGPASSQLRERVQGSGRGAAGERAYLADRRVRQILFSLADIRSKPKQTRDHKGNRVIAYEMNGHHLAKDVFCGRAGNDPESLSALYPGRKLEQAKSMLLLIVERLVEEYGLTRKEKRA